MLKDKHVEWIAFIVEWARDGIMKEDTESMVMRIFEAG
jgi:hypothetical protein